MYHHVDSDDKALSNSPELLCEHFNYIHKRYNVVLPGEKLDAKVLNICLTFDDAYFDFYHYVFPLLKEFNLKAVIGVPSHYILEKTALSPDVRLSLTHNEIYEGENYLTHAPFCTFEELREMQESGLVEIASHSHQHLNLSSAGVDLEQEIIYSKFFLKEKLRHDISTFILPFGKYNETVVKVAKEHYPYVMRIGNAINRDFSGNNGLIYRVKGDALKDAKSIFTWKSMSQYYLKFFIKKVF